MPEDGFVHHAGLLAGLVGFAEKQLRDPRLQRFREVHANVVEQHPGFFEPTHSLVEHAFDRSDDFAEQGAYGVGVARVAAVANQLAFNELGECPVTIGEGKRRELAFVDDAQLEPPPCLAMVSSI